MKNNAVFCCLSLFWLVASVTTIKTLKNIKDLKKTVNFVKEFPQHGLLLLHWFAHNVEIKDGEIRLHFDPDYGSYGLHCYKTETHKNIERSARSGFPESHYYSLGDLNLESSRMLPFYVTQDFHNSVGSQDRNMDRVLFKVQSNSPQRVYKVYITQKSQGTEFDPKNTFEISPQLLIQIQTLHKDVACSSVDPRLDFSPCQLLHHQQKAAKAEMVYPKTPGLAWFLTLAGYNIDRRLSTFLCSTNTANISSVDHCPLHIDDKSDCYGQSKMKLEVKSTSDGYARIVWSGIPESIARMEVNIALYKNGTQEEPLEEYSLNGRTFGSIDTSIPLNPGLQVRLGRSEKTSYYFVFSATHYMSFWKGPELDETNRVHPARVSGYDMSLQIYTKDGYAGARLYIKKSFTNWRNVFDNSWVGFYTSPLDDNDKYSKYKWVVNFEKRSKEDCPLDYDIFESESSLAIGPGVQARLMLTKHIASEKTRTVPWEEDSTFRE